MIVIWQSRVDGVPLNKQSFFLSEAEILHDNGKA